MISEFKIILNRKIITLLVLVVTNILLMVILAIATPEFRHFTVYSYLLQRMSEAVILAIAVTVVFISKNIDLSFGSTMALSGVICGILFNNGVPFTVAVLSALVSGIIVGLINALIIVQLRLDSFLTTLATMWIIRAIVYSLSHGRAITGFPEGFGKISNTFFFHVPLNFIIVILLMIFFIFFLKQTKLGRYIHAIGGNENAAIFFGINVNKIKYFVFILSSLLAALSGLIFASRTYSVSANAGLTAPLEIITAVVIGGTMFTGGDGTIIGSFLGVFVMYLLASGFTMLEINPFWRIITLGTIMIMLVGQEKYKKYFSRVKLFKTKK